LNYIVESFEDYYLIMKKSLSKWNQEQKMVGVSIFGRFQEQREKNSGW